MRIAIALCLLAGGCAYTTSTTRVAPMGDATYSVGASAGQYVGGSSEARTLALQAADGHCRSLGEPLSVLAVEPAGGRVDVTFRCGQSFGARAGSRLGYQPPPAINVNVNSRS